MTFAIFQTLKSNNDFPCNKDGCHSTRNPWPLARDYAGQEKSEKITKHRYDVNSINQFASLCHSTSFPGSSPSVPRVNTLVAASHVSADSRDVIEGRGWKVKVCLSTLAY